MKVFKKTIITWFTTITVFWLAWESFLFVGINLIESLFLLLRIDYNEYIIIFIRVCFLMAYLVAWLWIRGRTEKEVKRAEKRII